MSVSRTEVLVDDVLDGINAMRAAGRDLRPVMEHMKPLLKKDMAEHFDRNEGPDGPWPRRAEASIQRARRRKGYTHKRGKRKGTLRKRGVEWFRQQLGRFRYPSTYQLRMGRTFLEMRARGAWAGIHQFGGVAGRGSKIPARPFLWASETLVRRFGEALQDHLRGAWLGNLGGSKASQAEISAFFQRALGGGLRAG